MCELVTFDIKMELRSILRRLFTRIGPTFGIATLYSNKLAFVGVRMNQSKSTSLSLSSGQALTDQKGKKMKVNQLRWNLVPSTILGCKIRMWNSFCRILVFRGPNGGLIGEYSVPKRDITHQKGKRMKITRFQWNLVLSTNLGCRTRIWNSF